MYNVRGYDIDNIYISLARLINDQGMLQDTRHYKRGIAQTKELVHAAFTLTDSTQRFVFVRPINPAFAIAEVIWILAGSNDTEWISFWNPRMGQFTDKGSKYSYGAYGARLGSNPIIGVPKHKDGVIHSVDQLYQAYHALLGAPHSRQVVLNIYDALYDLPGAEGAPASADIPCNVTSCLLVRDGKLNWLQTMRSNDFVWGTPYNIIQWTCLQEIMAGWLGLEPGDYTHVVNSLHVYDNHFKELERISDGEANSELVNWSTLTVEGYAAWCEIFQNVWDLTVEMMSFDDYEEVADRVDILERVGERITFITHPGYREWMHLLLAECWRKLGDFGKAAEISMSLSDYYKRAWNNWLNSKM